MYIILETMCEDQWGKPSPNDVMHEVMVMFGASLILRTAYSKWNTLEFQGRKVLMKVLHL